MASIDQILWENFMLFVDSNLAEAYTRNPQYLKAVQEEGDAYTRLSNSLTENQIDLLDEYFQKLLESNSMREKIAYYQGMRIVVSAVMHLMLDRPETRRPSKKDLEREIARRQSRQQKRSQQEAGI